MVGRWLNLPVGETESRVRPGGRDITVATRLFSSCIMFKFFSCNTRLSSYITSSCAFIVDLSRGPSHGCTIAILLASNPRDVNGS